MNKPFNLNQIASTIADLIKQGLDIRVYVKKDVFDIWHVVVCDPSNLTSVHLNFNVADNEPEEQGNVNDDQSLFGRVTEIKPVALPTVKKAAKPISEKKKSAKWWSRFNFEKNIMKMTLLALQDRYPAEASFPQSVFAARLASMMSWEVSTARKHITRAAKMGILNRTVIGTVYHIAGINDVDADTARDEVADRSQPPVYKPLPGEHVNEERDKSRPAYYRELFDEGMPDLEHPIEKPVDETILP